MSMVFITSFTAPNSSGFGIDLTNIPQTFAHLQVRIFARSASNAVDYIRVSPLNDLTFGNYRSHQLYGNGTSALSSNNQTSGAVGFLNSGIPYSSSLANTYATYIVDLLDYTNTNKYTTMRAIGGWDDNNTSTTNANVSLSSYVWLNTAAITALTIASVNNPLQAGTRFDVYGITSSQVTGA